MNADALDLDDGTVAKLFAVDGIAPYGTCDWCGGPLNVGGECITSPGYRRVRDE